MVAPILLEKENSPVRSPQFSAKRDRIGISYFVAHSRSFAMLVMVVSYLGKHAGDGDLMSGREEKPSLNIYLVVIYVVALRFFLANTWRLRELWHDITNVTQSALRKVPTSEQTLTRLKIISRKSMKFFGCLGSAQYSGHSIEISANDPFVSLEDIASLSLRDLRDIFNYALECNRSDFKRRSFLRDVRPITIRAIESMDRATLASRGSAVGISQTKQKIDYGAMDALMFAAATRIFAEWRSLRLVPGGFPRYSYSMTLVRRDLIKNAGKIETAVHALLSEKEKMMNNSEDMPIEQISSPTIRELIQHEISHNMHTNRPQIQDRSGSSGILWVKRQLQYQAILFGNLLEVPTSFPNAKSAVIGAYKSVYDDYHGFFAKQIFQSGLEAAPDLNSVLQAMIPEGAEEDDTNITAASSNTDDEDEFWTQMDIEIVQSTSSEWEEAVQKNPLEQFVSQMTTKFQCIPCAGTNSNDPSRDIMLLRSDCTSEHSATSSRSTKMAKNDINRFLFVMQPLVEGLDKLVKDFNINDPTKV